MNIIRSNLVALCLCCSMSVIAQTAPVGTAAIGQSAAAAGLGTVPALAIPAIPQQAPAGQASGLTRPLLPNAGEGSVGATQTAPARPPLQRTEFQNFIQDNTGVALPLFGYNLFESTGFTPVAVS